MGGVAGPRSALRAVWARLFVVGRALGREGREATRNESGSRQLSTCAPFPDKVQAKRDLSDFRDVGRGRRSAPKGCTYVKLNVSRVERARQVPRRAMLGTVARRQVETCVKGPRRTRETRFDLVSDAGKWAAVLSTLGWSRMGYAIAAT